MKVTNFIVPMRGMDEDNQILPQHNFKAQQNEMTTKPKKKVRIIQQPNSIPIRNQLGDIALEPSKYGDTFIPQPRTPTPPDQHTLKIRELAMKGPSGKSIRGWDELPKSKMYQKEEDDRDVELLKLNLKTPLGEASYKGLQNNDRGESHWSKEEDLNDRQYFSSNIYDKYNDAKLRYTISSRPQGPIKVRNLNHVISDDPEVYHDPINNQPYMNSINQSRAGIIPTTQRYHERKVNELYGEVLEDDNRFVEQGQTREKFGHQQQQTAYGGVIVGGVEANDRLGTSSSNLKSQDRNTITRNSKGFGWDPLEKQRITNYNKEPYLSKDQEMLSMQIRGEGPYNNISRLKSKQNNNIEYYGTSRYEKLQKPMKPSNNLPGQQSIYNTSKRVFYNELGIPTQVPTTSKLRDDQLGKLKSNMSQTQLSNNNEIQKYNYRNVKNYTEPQTQFKAHPVFQQNNQYDWVFQKYDVNNINNGGDLLYWQEPMIQSSQLGNQLKKNATLSTLHRHSPYEIKLHQYDLEGQDDQVNSKSSTQKNLPLDRRTYLSNDKNVWYLPKANDRMVLTTNREQIKHRFSHFYLYLYQDQFKEIVIMFDLFNDQIEKFQLPILPVSNPSFVQISDTQIFICGGIIREPVLNHKNRGVPSGFSAIYDCQKSQLVIVSDMNHARYSHGICVLDNEVYVLGGITQNQYSCGKCERFNLETKQWQNLPSCAQDRLNPKLCVSFNSKIIYVFGGIPDSFQQNKQVEMFITQSSEWRPLKVQLPLEFRGNRQHFAMMVEGKFYMPPLATEQIENSLFNDLEDKIILFQYGSVADILPDIFILYLERDEAKLVELHYDKANSDISSYQKKDVIFDPLSKRIIAFTGLDPTLFDYISINEDFFMWKQGRFVSKLFQG